MTRSFAQLVKKRDASEKLLGLPHNFVAFWGDGWLCAQPNTKTKPEIRNLYIISTLARIGHHRQSRNFLQHHEVVIWLQIGHAAGWRV